MKMRVVCYSKKKKMDAIADAIAAAQGCRSDKLPLAYPFDKERVTIFVASVPHEDLRRMMPEMVKERSANVAFVIDGPEAVAKEYIDAAKAAGTNVLPNVLYVKCGGFLPAVFGSASEDEKKQAVKWAEEVVANLK